MRWLILAFAAIPALAVWATVAYVGTARGWWAEPLAPRGDRAALLAALHREIDDNVPGAAALIVLANGAVVDEYYTSVDGPVDAHSRFQVASVSKWITAWGVMALAEDGLLDLDAPVSGYLSRWQLPDGPHDPAGVTARRLLSHTAGLTDGLGYLGFPPDEPVQSLEASLTRARDAMEGADGRVLVGIPPGDEWRYSGGGYALLHLLIEEISGQPLENFMQARVLEPLGMYDSTFAPDVVERRVPSYGPDGVETPYRRFAAPAAAGLFTTASDLTRFLSAQLPGAEGAPPGRDVLSPETLASMRAPHASVMGTDVWGLGQILYAGNGQGGHVIGHDGSNAPAISTSARLDPATGNGIVLLVSGHPTLASDLGGGWVLWQTGSLDVATFYAGIGDLIRRVALGWVVITAAVIVIGWRVNARRSPLRQESEHEGDRT